MNVGNLRVEARVGYVRLCQHVRHPTHLDCILTYDEVRTLVALLSAIKPPDDVDSAQADVDDLL